MSDRANIKVGREFYENHNERRKDLGLTWEEYIESQAPETPSVDLSSVQLEASEYGKIAREVAEVLR